MNCPSLDQLIDYLRGQLSSSEKNVVQTHLATGCQHCDAEFAWLTETLQLTRSDDSFDFSEDHLRWAVNLFKSQTAARETSIQRWLGRLIFDSFRAQPLAATRSDLMTERTVSGRQMLYKADAWDVDLRFEREGNTDTETLIGQVLSEQNLSAPAAFTVRLMQGNEETASTFTNASGMFRFTHLSTGSYDLLIRVPEGEIQISEISSGQSFG